MRLFENAPDPTGEFPAATPEYALYLAFQVTRHRDMLFDQALAPIGLSLNRWRSLSVVRRLGACTMKELALYTTIDRTTLTRSVDQLVAAGVVERGGARDDRRKVVLSLTGAGEAVFLEAAVVIVETNRIAFAGVSDETGRVIARGLADVLRNLVPDEGLARTLLRMGPDEASPDP